MRCYRLYVLDDGIWLVIHAGTLDYVKARQQRIKMTDDKVTGPDVANEITIVANF